MKIAITGGIAAGKSTVAKMLAEELGYPLFSVDTMIANIYEELAGFALHGKTSVFDQRLISKLHEQLCHHFGKGGIPSRQSIAEQLVQENNPAKFDMLERLFDPVALAMLEDMNTTFKNYVMEFPLLFEKGDPTKYDFVVNVESPLDVREHRASLRPFADPAKLALMMARQTTDENRRTLSHYTLVNPGTKGGNVLANLEKLQAQVKILALRVKLNRKQIGILSGSFDPFTNGHVDLVNNGFKLLDTVVIVIGTNRAKKPMFSIDERIAMIKASTYTDIDVIVLPDDELVINLAKQLDAKYIIRGLRNTTDFDYEQQIDLVQTKIAPEIKTLYFMPPRELTEVSSSLVKSLHGLNGWVEIAKPYVPAPVLEALIGKLK